MLIFWDQTLVLLSTPKTGSTALAAALESRASVAIEKPPVLKHTTLQRFHRFLGPYLEVSSGRRFEVAALIREPRDWLGSWYRYRSRDDITDPTRSTKGMSFDTFVNAWCDTPQPEFAAVGSQARFLQPKGGKAVDHLFRHAEIEKLVRFLEDRLGGRIDLPRLNVSPPGALDLSPQTEARLRRTAAADFELYETLQSR